MSDLAKLDFAKGQVKAIEEALKEIAAQDERVPLLVQVTDIGLLTAITILAAIGEIVRFPSSKQLVGYSGLGRESTPAARVSARGRITKAGRKDLRSAMVEAAHHAVQDHPHFKGEYERLCKTIGKKKAMVAVARKLLVVVWYLLAKGAADKFADPTQVACSMFAFAHKVRVKNLPNGMSALQFMRTQMDRLGIGQEVLVVPWGTKRYKLPPSKLKQDETSVPA